MDPRQAKFLAAYTNPNSPTFSNALKSALHAGYAQEYAESITSQGNEWLSESLRDVELLNQAEKVLQDTLRDDYEIESIIVEGEEIGEKRNPALAKIRQDSAKFVAERLGKNKYSQKTTLEGNLNLTVNHLERLKRIHHVEEPQE